MRKIILIFLFFNVLNVYSSGWYTITHRYENNDWVKITPVEMSFNETTKEIVVYDVFFKVYYYTTLKRERNKDLIKITGDMKDSYQGKNTLLLYFFKNDSNIIEFKNYKTETKFKFNTKK